MPRYSAQSRERLEQSHADLQAVFNEVIRHFDNSILTGHRGEAEQNALFNARPQRSKVPWPNSKHNRQPSDAVDAAPYPIDWGEEGDAETRRKAIARFYHFAGYVLGVADQLGVQLRWGGDWDSDREFTDQTFDDLVHFERVT